MQSCKSRVVEQSEPLNEAVAYGLQTIDFCSWLSSLLARHPSFWVT